MDTTWTKYVKILKSGDHVICFNVSQGSTVSFSLEEFPNLVPMLRLRIWAQRNRGLLFGQRSQHNLGLPGGETELGASGGQSIGVSTSTSVLPMNTQG